MMGCRFCLFYRLLTLAVAANLPQVAAASAAGVDDDSVVVGAAAAGGTGTAATMTVMNDDKDTTRNESFPREHPRIKSAPLPSAIAAVVTKHGPAMELDDTTSTIVRSKGDTSIRRMKVKGSRDSLQCSNEHNGQLFFGLIDCVRIHRLRFNDNFCLNSCALVSSFWLKRGWKCGKCPNSDNAPPLPPPPPTKAPVLAPVKAPTKAPAKAPTAAPVKDPTKAPVKAPTAAPVKAPTKAPVKDPTAPPIKAPTKAPVKDPTKAPVKDPTKAPVKAPTKAPVTDPTKPPTNIPTTKKPTTKPTTKQPTNKPTKSPTLFPTPANGFCNWGPLGTAESSTCSGGAQGGEFCNFHRIHCVQACGGKWCNDEPDPAPVAPQLGGFCNWGYDGSKEKAVCWGGRVYGPDGSDKDFCHLSPDHCLQKCNGRWCNTYKAGPTTAPSLATVNPPAYCNYGYDGTGATSTCVGGPMGGDWCNASKGQCEGNSAAAGFCNGKWCTA